jgi:hypothetical protein
MGVMLSTPNRAAVSAAVALLVERARLLTEQLKTDAVRLCAVSVSACGC